MLKCCMNCNCNLGNKENHNQVVSFNCLIKNKIIVRTKDYYNKCDCINFIPRTVKLKTMYS